MFGIILSLSLALATPNPTQCSIHTEEEAGRVLLVGVCGMSAAVIGTASSYDAEVHRRTGAVAVLMTRDASVQVVVVRPEADGSARLENVTGDLARRVGRSPYMGLSGLTVDLSHFAIDGIIGITAEEAKGNMTPAADGVFTVDALVAHEAARAARLAEKSHKIYESDKEQGREQQ